MDWGSKILREILRDILRKILRGEEVKRGSKRCTDRA